MINYLLGSASKIVSASDTVVSARERLIQQCTRVSLVLLLISALGLTLLRLTRIHEPFLHHHGWNGAICYTIAKAYNYYGLWELGLRPVQNLGPVEYIGDYYIHWPPLFWIILSRLFLIFGDGEAVGRILVTLLSLVNITWVVLIARRWLATWTSLMAGAIYAVIPVTFAYSDMVYAYQLCSVAALGAVYCMTAPQMKTASHWRWEIAAWLLIAAGIWTSWEAFLLVPTVLLRLFWQRDARTVAISLRFAAVSMLSLGALVVVYLGPRDEMAREIMDAAAFRMGLSEYAPEAGVYTFYNVREYKKVGNFSRIRLYAEMMGRGIQELSGIACVAILLIMLKTVPALQRGETWPELLYWLGLPALLWFVLFPRQAAVHTFQFMIWAPMAAICVALLVQQIVYFAARSKSVRVFALGGVWLAIAFQGALKDQLAQKPAEDIQNQYEMARILNDRTYENSVILTAYENAIVTCYSDRHVIRGVGADEYEAAMSHVDRHLENHPVVFAGYYGRHIALHRKLREKGFTPIIYEDKVVLYELKGQGIRSKDAAPMNDLLPETLPEAAQPL